MLVYTTDELNRLIRLLRSQTRRTPLIIVTQRADKSGPVITAMRLQHALGSSGTVRTLSGSMLGAFNRAMQRFPIHPRGVRLYQHSVDIYDQSQRHPMWAERLIDEMGEEQFIALLKARCQLEARPVVPQKHTVKIIPHVKRPLLCAKKSENLELPHRIEASSD
jgi:hypothetical protein